MIIVMGATGFVGRYLVELLVRSGEEVLACGRNTKYEGFFRELGVSFEPVDVTRQGDFERLPSSGIKAYVHLSALIPAAVTDVKTDQFLKVNTLGTLHALESCRKNGIRKFVWTGSRFAYSGHTLLPIREEMGPCFAMTGDHASYIISKIAASQYIEHYSQEYGMQGIDLCLTGILGLGRLEGVSFGGGFRPSAFEVFYTRARSGEPIELWGKHEARRDALYVKDAAAAIYAAIQSDRARGTYLIGSGVGRTTEEEAMTFAEVFGTPDRPVSIVNRPDLKDDDKSYYFDISKAKRDLGWQPTYSYAEILRDYAKEVASGRFRS